MLSVVFGAGTAVVAVGPEDVLTVGARVRWLALVWEGENGDGRGNILHVEVKADSARGLESINLGFDGPELGSVSGCETLVGF